LGGDQGQPVFEHNGPVAYIKVAKAHVTFGFWRGAELGESALERAGVMRYLKVAAMADIAEARLAGLVRKAVELNCTEGDSTQRRR
jgi:hypothetical protein